MISYGFADADAVAAYRAYNTFLLGHLLLEASGQGAHLHSDEALLDHDSTVTAADYPQLQRLRDMLSTDDSAAEFDESLEALLDRLEMRLSTQD